MNAPVTLHQALVLAGVGHFAILTASALVPMVCDWKTSLKPLPPFLRTLFWVYGVFIVLTIIGFGTLTLLNARPMSDGQPVARSLAGFIAVFWALRLVVQFFVFDTRPYLTNAWLKLGNHLLTVTFAAFVTIYGIAAFRF